MSLQRRVFLAGAMFALVVGSVFGAFISFSEQLKEDRESVTSVRAINDASLSLGALIEDLEAEGRRVSESQDSEEHYMLDFERASRLSKRLKRLVDERESGWKDRIKEVVLPFSDANSLRRPTETEMKRFATASITLDSVLVSEQRKLSEQQLNVDRDAKRITYASYVGFVVVLILIIMLCLYLRRFITRPLRETAAAALEMSEGKRTELPVGGKGEVGDLRGALNTLVSSLETSEDRYKNLVDRLPVATYVAEVGASSPWIFISHQLEDTSGLRLCTQMTVIES